MILFVSCAAAVFLLDLISKHIVSSGMELGSTVSLVPGVFDLTYIVNKGAAWGILSGKQMLLQVFTAVLMVVLTAYAAAKRKTLGKPELLALGLIVGGGLGNFISRVSEGQVVDFFNIHVIPVFNVADIGITVGCVLLVIAALFSDRKKDADGK